MRTEKAKIVSNNYEAHERREVRKGLITADALHIDEHEFGETAEERRFDELVEMFAKKMLAAEARQLARDVLALDAKRDAQAAAEAVEDTGGVSMEERLLGRYRAMFFEIKNATRPVLHLRVVMMALGWADEKVESLRRCAADYALSPEGVRKMMAGVQQRHRLPPSQFNKDARARARVAANGRVAGA